MLPDSLLGVGLFIALLTPGLLFVQRRERYHPGIRYSVLRETSLVLVVSTVTNTIAIATFGLVSHWIAGSKTAVDELFADPGKWLETNYRSGAVCAIAMLSASAAIALMLAVPPSWMIKVTWGSARSTLERWRGERQQLVSAWTMGLQALNTEKAYTIVGIRLTDGNFVQGIHKFASSNVIEDGERSILLSEPIFVQEGTALVRVDAHYAEISASQISYLLITYASPAAVETLVDIEAGQPYGGVAEVEPPVEPAVATWRQALARRLWPDFRSC